MTKNILIVFFSILLFFAIDSRVLATGNANPCDKYIDVKKIMWGDEELKKGQIGRVKIKTETVLYKLQGTKKIPTKNYIQEPIIEFIHLILVY
jgi:hypothetical protein